MSHGRVTTKGLFSLVCMVTGNKTGNAVRTAGVRSASNFRDFEGAVWLDTSQSPKHEAGAGAYHHFHPCLQSRALLRVKP